MIKCYIVVETFDTALNGTMIKELCGAYCTKSVAEAKRVELEEAYHEKFPGYRQYSAVPLTQFIIKEVDLL